MKHFLAAALLGVSVHAQAGSASVIGSALTVSDLNAGDGIEAGASMSFSEGLTHILHDTIDLCFWSDSPQITALIVAPGVENVSAEWDFDTPSATATAMVSSGFGVASSIMSFTVLLAPFTAAAFSGLTTISDGQAGGNLYDSSFNWLGGHGSFASSSFAFEWANEGSAPAAYSIQLFASSSDGSAVRSSALASPIPEPATLVLMAAGLIALGWQASRVRRIETAGAAPCRRRPIASPLAAGR